MKFKLDFITNSSSTAFFFIFKGNRKEDLFEVISKYPKRFEQHDDLGWDKEPNIVNVDAKFIIENSE